MPLISAPRNASSCLACSAFELPPIVRGSLACPCRIFLDFDLDVTGVHLLKDRTIISPSCDRSDRKLPPTRGPHQDIGHTLQEQARLGLLGHTNTNARMNGENSDGFAQTNPAEHPKNSLNSRLEFRTEAGNRVKTPPKLQCSEPGCQYSGKFRSKHELRRHSLCIHFAQNEARPFTCGALGCLKGGHVTRFARADKLTAHIRNVHARPTLFECPRDGCQQSPLDGLQMFVHVKSHVEMLEPAQIALLKSVACAFSPEFVRCPIDRCGRNLLLHHIIDHLLDHGDAAIRSNSTALARLGLLYAPSVREDATTISSLWDATTMDLEWAAPFMRIFILCPLCRLGLSNCVDFRTHLIDIHVHTNSPHFGIWITHVEETLKDHGYASVDAKTGGTIRELLRKANVWTAWRFVLMNSHTVDVQFRCPECSAPEKVTGNMTAVHHLSMLGRFAELRAYRREILALCPQFASHPVFKDIHASQQFKEPHAFRLRKVSGFNATEVLASNDHKESAEMAPAWRFQYNSTYPSPPNTHVAPSTSDTIATSARYALTGIGGQFHDPMIGGLEDIPVGANSTGESDMHATPPKVTSCPVAGRIGGDTQMIRHPATIYQPYNHGKAYVCDHDGCELRFERLSELHLHQRAHVNSRQRPHECKLCGKRFTYPKDRKRHEKTHPELRDPL